MEKNKVFKLISFAKIFTGTVMENMDSPIWTTEKGGLVKLSEADKGENFIFFKTPIGCSSLKVGGIMPENWLVEPLNKLARIISPSFRI